MWTQLELLSRMIRLHIENEPYPNGSGRFSKGFKLSKDAKVITMVDLQSQAIEKGSEEERTEAELEELWESKGGMARPSLSQYGRQGREDLLMGLGQTLQRSECDSSGPAMA